MEYAPLSLIWAKIQQNFVWRQTEKNSFFINISKTNDNRPYVTSQLVNKCDHCSYLKPKIKSLRPSQAKIQKCDIGAWRVFREIVLQASE